MNLSLRLHPVRGNCPRVSNGTGGRTFLPDFGQLGSELAERLGVQGVQLGPGKRKKQRIDENILKDTKTTDANMDTF